MDGPADTQEGNTMTNLNDAMIAAIDAAFKADAIKSAKGNLTEGTHTVDFTVRVQATLDKGADTMVKPTTSMPWLTVLALFVQRSGFQRDAAMDMIRAAMTDAVNMDGDAAKALASAAGVDAAKELFDAEVLSQLPKVPRQGAVKAKAVNVTVVD